MSARDQVFAGTVTGDVAGRDVVKNIHVAHARPESELQALFLKHTGIDCRREAREQFELLMLEHGFTGKELSRAWRFGSLVWSEPARRLMPSARKTDMVVGWIGTALMTSVLIFALVETMHRMPGPFLKPITIFFTCAVYLGLTRALLLVTIFPQATAMRVERVFSGDKACRN